MAGTAGSAITVEDAIDHTGFGRFQQRLLIVCGITWAADAAEVLMVAFALPAVIKEFGITPAQGGLIASATFLGMLVGAWFWGTISDRIGRRTGFMITVGIFAVFGIASAFAPNAVWLAVFRALTGFGLGGALPLDFSLFAEYLPRKNRGRWLVILESFWGLGTLTAAGLAWLIIPNYGWRPFMATSALAALLVFWIRVRVPESPRYLATVGRPEEARKVIDQVARENGRPPLEGEIERPAGFEPPRVGMLFQRGLARTTAAVWITWFCISLGYYGLFTWLPSIFAQQGFSFVRTYGYVFILALAQLPGYFSAAWLIERLGRKPVLSGYLAVSAVMTYLFAVADNRSLILTAAILMSFFTLGAFAALYAYTPEVYPTEIRTTGMGAASSMARISGVIAPYLGGILIPISLVAALSVYSIAFLVGALAIAVLAYETRGRGLADTIAAARATTPQTAIRPGEAGT